jgi:hypothetical protein
MWNKERFKDPTTVNARTPQQQPKESVLQQHPFAQDLSLPPAKVIKEEFFKAQTRRLVNQNPRQYPDHSGCTNYWCAHAVGSHASSFAEYTAILNARYEERQLADKQRRLADSLLD